MYKQVIAAAAAAAMVVGIAAPASAQLAPRPTTVKGSVTQEAKASTIVGVAIGQRATAVAGQCVVYEETTVGGDVKQTCKADTIVAVAIGQDTHASAVQGGVGAPKPSR